MPTASPSVTVLDLGVSWRVGAEGPVVVSDPWFAAIAFLTDPDNDDDVAVVSFQDCRAIKNGSPNDEVLKGHPLYARGLTFYAAHEVENSPWLADLVEVNRVHERFDALKWVDYRHFVFTFQESTVEVIARGYIVQKASDGLPGAAARMAAQGS